MRDDAVPPIVGNAGPRAVAAYRSYFDSAGRSRGTRRLYAAHARRFFRWAESRGLTLETIDAKGLAAYADEIAAARSRHEAAIYLTPVRGVLGHLARAGVLASDPCPRGQPNGRGGAEYGPPPSMPKRPEEWQAAVDAAEAALMLDSLMQYGLIEGDGLAVDAGRCREILDLGRSLGYTPRPDDGGGAHG